MVYQNVAAFNNASILFSQNKKHKQIYNKLKRIWFVLRDKDYQYSEFYMSKNEFCEFKEYIDSIECEFKGNEV